MKKHLLLLLTVLLYALPVMAAEPHLVPSAHAGTKPADGLLVKYKTPLPQEARHQLLGQLNIKRLHLNPGQSLQTQQAQLKQNPDIAWTQPNRWRYAQAVEVTPNDIYYRPERNDRHYQQWYLYMINANYAWSLSKGGAAMTVAVVDSGADFHHPDLKDRLLPGRTIITQSDYTPPADGMDDNGHGTHVAGLIAAMSNNETGICGTSWLGKLLPVKVLNNKGEGTDADIAAGIIWAADQGARIINLSLGGADDDGSVPQVLQDAVTYAHQQGCLVIAAAGNSGDNSIFYPASLDYVVSVAATDPWDRRADYSTYNAYVDLAAPGGAGSTLFDIATGIISTYWSPNSEALDSLSGPEAGDYAVTAGTSMAAAITSGAALVLWSHEPAATAEDIENTFKNTAVDIGPAGPDVQTGSGRIDLLAAMDTTVPVIPELRLYNYPNPFRPGQTPDTKIVFYLSAPEKCTLRLYDAARVLVWKKTLSTGQTMAGKNILSWDGRNQFGADVANGTYLMQLTTEHGHKSSIKFISVIR